jgi:pimeloyl-ACP methyl ester carboxylesterase
VKKPRSHVHDLRGASRLAIEATKRVTDLVEAMHMTIGSGPAILGRPLEGPTRLATGLVYGGIRGVADWVGVGIDRALAELGGVLGQSAPGPEREAVLAALNGVLGDYLSETGNPLAIDMSLGRAGIGLELERTAIHRALPDASGRLVVLIHGSCMHAGQWERRGHDHGAALAKSLGKTCVYLQYNSGLHISTNGRAFSELLERLVAEWPTPLQELTLIGHSMGGLVARAACHVAESSGHRWRTQLGAMVCLGSPHHGAPLERGGNWIDVLLGATPYSAPLARLGKIRSAGVTDLRHGNVLDEHWQGHDRFALQADPRARLELPAGVRCYAIAGTTTKEPAEKLLGDGLVPVDSALGRHPKRELSLEFPDAHQLVAFETGHLDLLDSREVYAAVESFLS